MHPVRLLAAVALAVLAAAAPAAASGSSGLVVSQLYASGGNSGATFANDYVELYNRGSATVDLTGWSIQYATASGTSWQATALSGSVAPGRHYLVQLASAAAVGAPLPAPDATGTSNLAVSGGKVAVVSDAAPLACGASAGSCSSVAAVEDLVGYGSATDYEGAGAAPAPSATTAIVRAGGGCTDTDSNGVDFATAAPAPLTSAAAAVTCTAAPPPAASAAADAGVDVDVQPVLAIALERPSVSFGTAVAGSTPAPLSEQVTVVSNNGAGYSLTVHRSAFSPADLPLGIMGSAPAGGQLGSALSGGVLAPVPVAPALDLLIGTTSAPSAAAGDVWPTSLGFTSALPVVPAGRYSSTVTFTVIGR